jgi:hypothetical protein
MQRSNFRPNPLLNAGTDTLTTHDWLLTRLNKNKYHWLFCYWLSLRYSADRAWAVSDSPRASTEATRPNCAAPAGEQLIMELRF